MNFAFQLMNWRKIICQKLKSTDIIFGNQRKVKQQELKEAAIVAYALDTSNWNNLSEGSWSGSCWIDIDNPIEINEE